MIDKIQIENIATYEDNIEINPTEINYFYGANGSGKTTLSNLIRDPLRYPTCSIDWKSEPLQTIVYNRDFIKENFSQNTSIKGIFTLGKDSKDARDFIEQATKDIGELDKQITGNKKTLQAKNGEKQQNEEVFINRCWDLKLKYELIFKEAFNGVRRLKKKFSDKCISEYTSNSKLLTEDEIKDKCNKIFNNSLIKYNNFDTFTYKELYDLERNDILKTKIIGKEDIQIGNLIKKLNNSDWVKQGVDFLNESDLVCPLCQQKVDIRLKEELESFFDETYTRKCKELEYFREKYSKLIIQHVNKLEAIIESKIDILCFDELVIKVNLIKEKLKVNLSNIDMKIKAPSIPIELESIINDFEEVELIVEKYRQIIKENNELVKNISKEQEQLKNEIWRYICNELKSDIDTYKSKLIGIEAAEAKLKQSTKEKEDKIRDIKRQINDKESEITSVIYTVNEINKILKLFGFNNFSLAEAAEKGFYKIIRKNGEDVEETLSEGEYTFICFLYFYQLIKGSTEKTGTTGDKIIVIDDPISSLDSNVLFIVSNLVKSIIKDCQNGESGIKQVFILTHNVYFHKEVTFKGNGGRKTSKESFWMVRKLNDISKINKHDDNPIKTTYELLWRELDNPEDINTATIFNTLRRILEYYFNILGGMKYEDLINQFEGEDMLVCRSLVSWINDGSHFIGDDLEMPIEADNIEKYINVFKLIFEKTGHISHYNMMTER